MGTRPKSPSFFWETSSFFVRFNLTSFAQYLRAAETRGGVAQACRAAPSGDDKVRKCCPREPCCTLGQRRCTKVSLKRAVLRPRVTIKHESVAQESRAAPSGDDKCGFSLPKGFLHPYFILPCALGQREGAEESPDCAARHLRVRDSQASSFPESSAPSHAPVVGGVQGGGAWSCGHYIGHYIRHIRLIFGNFYYFCPEACHTASRPVPVTQGRSGIQTESVTDGRQVIYQSIAELIGLTRL